MSPDGMIRVRTAPDGAFEVIGIPPLLAWAIRELPSLLADDAEGIEDRICPTPYPDDPDLAREWRRLNEPELAHLFRTARELVTEDLRTLEYVKGSPASPISGFRIRIPAENRAAWLSALAAARVAKGEAHGITAEDMERDFDPEENSLKDRVVLLVNLLGWMQGILIEGPDGDHLGR